MATLRQRLAVIVGVAMVLGTTLFSGLALAQTTYPPGTSTVPPSCTAGNVNAGTVTVGQSFKVVLCGAFLPGASIPTTVNSEAVGSKTANADGTVVVLITINSQGTATVNDPVKVEIQCGTNTVSATGTGAKGGTVTANGTFVLSCTSTATTTSTSGLALTGANILKAVLVALALIGFGILLVTAQRRRRRTI